MEGRRRVAYRDEGTGKKRNLRKLGQVSVLHENLLRSHAIGKPFSELFDESLLQLFSGELAIDCGMTQPILERTQRFTWLLLDLAKSTPG